MREGAGREGGMSGAYQGEVELLGRIMGGDGHAFALAYAGGVDTADFCRRPGRREAWPVRRHRHALGREQKAAPLPPSEAQAMGMPPSHDTCPPENGGRVRAAAPHGRAAPRPAPWRPPHGRAGQAGASDYPLATH